MSTTPSTTSASFAAMSESRRNEKSWRDLERNDDETEVVFRVRRNSVRFRQEQGLTQEIAAARVGITYSQMSKMEAGARGIDHDMVRRLADAYAHDVPDFHVDEPPPAKRSVVGEISTSVVRAGMKRMGVEISEEQAAQAAKLWKQGSVDRAHEIHKEKAEHKRKRQR